MQLKACFSVSSSCPHLTRNKPWVEEVKLLACSSNIPTRKVCMTPLAHLWKHWVRRMPFCGRGATIRRSPPFGDQASPLGGPRDAHTGGCVSPMDNTNCLQWRAESSGSFFLFLSPDIHPSKHYFWNASVLKKILQDSPSS